MYSKLNVLFVIGVLLFVWPNVVQAQSEHPLFCAKLSSEDCALLSSTRDTMSQIHSMSSDSEVELILRDIPDAGLDEITVNIQQQSHSVLTDEGIAVREKLGDVTLVSKLLQEDPTDILKLYSEMAQTAGFDSSLRIEASDDAAALIHAAIEANSGENLLFDLPTELAVDSQLVDGMFYVNLREMDETVPAVEAIQNNWFGYEIAPLIDIAIANVHDNGDQEAVITDDAMAFTQLAAAISGGNDGPLITMIADLPQGADVVPFFNVERTEDDGTKVRFRTTIDYVTLLSDPFVQEWLADLIRDSEFGDMRMSDSEMEQVISFVELMGPTVLDSLGLEVIDEIDPETNFVLGREFHLNLDIDALAPMIAMAGGPDLSDSEVAPVISLNSTVAYTNHNSDMTLRAPDDDFVVPTPWIVAMIPTEELQQLFVSSSPTEVGTIDREQADALLEEALSLYENARGFDDYQEFIALLDQVIAFDSENIIALMARGSAYGEMGEYQYAIVDYGTVLAFEPAYVEVAVSKLDPTYAHGLHSLLYYQRSIMYFELGENELSIADVTMAIEMYPSEALSYPSLADLYSNRAYLHSEMGRMEEADADQERALELDPEEQFDHEHGDD